jgi:methionyl-tRNA formyltransferase
MGIKRKIGFIGCLQVGFDMLIDLIDSGIKPDYIISISPEKASQQKVSGFADFSSLAADNNIPFYITNKYSLKSEEDELFFKQQSFDLIIQGGWQRLFPETILQTVKIGIIGVHGSSEFLPFGRGRSPLNWSIIEEKKRFLLHFFLIKAGVDDGDVFAVESFDINEFDTIQTLYYKNSILSRNMILKYLPELLSGEAKVIPQSGNATYYPQRTEEDGLIDFNQTVFEIYNQIRALTHPYPGAHVFLNGVKIKIWKAQVFDTRITYPQANVGEVVEVFNSGDFVINCYSGLLLVTDCKPENKVIKGAIFE